MSGSSEDLWTELSNFNPENSSTKLWHKPDKPISLPICFPSTVGVIKSDTLSNVQVVCVPGYLSLTVPQLLRWYEAITVPIKHLEQGLIYFEVKWSEYETKSRRFVQKILEKILLLGDKFYILSKGCRQKKNCIFWDIVSISLTPLPLLQNFFKMIFPTTFWNSLKIYEISHLKPLLNLVKWDIYQLEICYNPLNYGKMRHKPIRLSLISPAI